jgi:hypothetical protein
LFEIPEKVFQQNLRPQVEKVGRFVQHQQIGILEQQCRQLDPGLPATGKGFHQPLKVSSFQLKLPCNFAAPPIRLAAVPHQEIES